MTEKRIQIEVNGRAREVSAGRTVAQLLEELEVDRRAVVVEVNRRIVRREELDRVTLEPEDRVELVHFVGGG